MIVIVVAIAGILYSIRRLAEKNDWWSVVYLAVCINVLCAVYK